jgi:CxxC motif-containing protein (DUF1111 family)
MPLRKFYLAAGFFLAAGMSLAQTDPGPRGGAPGAGGPIVGLTSGELSFFNSEASPTFAEVENVSQGLGPRFNLDSCGGCHAHPALGGSSPPVNPQVSRLSAMAPGNTLPSFLTANGPVREVRFVRNSDGSSDGGVHALFTIAGRSDKPAGCAIQQPDFATQQRRNNVIFRIPTPTFGNGLIEAITETTLRNNVATDPGALKARAGVSGQLNLSGNDGTVTRFGWKAQNKSLLIFSGEAYNVEMGVTNEAFPSEREEDPTCSSMAAPNDHSTFTVGSTTPSDLLAFTAFMRFLDQPAPVTSFGGVTAASVTNGRALFVSTGCALCHTPTLMTGTSSTPALSGKAANLFSDLAVHKMGSILSDGVTQGYAGPDEFRTAPLWGLGQRLFLLHDGRTRNLMEAIAAHQTDCGRNGSGTTVGSIGGGGCSQSEANQVIDNFNNLRNSQEQELPAFALARSATKGGRGI